MKNYKWIVIAANLLVVLAIFNYSIIGKEKTLSDGTLVLLKLAPVDPRSLMQGDYMVLRYEMSEIDYSESNDMPNQGYCVVKVGSDGVAEKIRFQKDLHPVNESEHLIKYKQGERGIRIGAESFFFEEGKAELYEKAEYGALRVDKNGNSILVGLYDNNKQKIN